MSSQKNNPIINIEQTKQILWQLQNNICKIYSGSGNGTGFFCKIPYPDQFKLLPVLITNNHVLNEEDIKLFKTIKLTIDNDNFEKNLIIDPERQIFTNEDIDITIIEIKPFDGIFHFLDVDENLLFDNDFNKLYKDKTIYVLEYPKGIKSSHSIGKIKGILNINIDYNCSTDSGSSGSPILNLSNYKVIGVHKRKGKFHNQGTLIKLSMQFKNFKKIIIFHLI